MAVVFWSRYGWTHVQSGAKVVILTAVKKPANKLVNELIAKGYEASYFMGDVLNNEVLEQNSQDIVAKYGRIDVVVNAAEAICRATIIRQYNFRPSNGCFP